MKKKIVKLCIGFLRNLSNNRKLILTLAKKDFEQKYLGSYLGIMWAFVQPIIMILIYWYLFQVGFKSVPVDNFPFILWFITGMVPWMFFSDCISNATNSILDNSYLVKKVVFPLSLLPIIKIISSLFIHMFFIIILYILFILYGYSPDMYSLQFIYYSIALLVFILGLSWLTSALVVFLKDIGQFISMCLQFLFWLTPILWSFNILPSKYEKLFKLNPLFYIVEGYRDAFIYHKWFWEHSITTPYYWIVTTFLLVFGAIIFKKLKPHFADIM